MSVDTEQVEQVERRGLSRRDMIRASAIAGAAAWTAPVIIDSLSSPAAAFSGTCVPYVVKLVGNSSIGTIGACFSQCFGGTASICFDSTDAKWGGSCGAPGGCGTCGSPSFTTSFKVAGGTAHMPVTTSPTGYRQVKFTGGCGFSKATSWQIGGRYGTTDPGSEFVKIPTSATCTSPSGSGCYDPASNTAWIASTLSNGHPINYIYVKYCCPTGS